MEVVSQWRSRRGGGRVFAVLASLSPHRSILSLRKTVVEVASRWRSCRSGGRVAVEVASRWRSRRGGGRVAVEVTSRWRSRCGARRVTVTIRNGDSRWRMKSKCCWTNLARGEYSKNCYKVNFKPNSTSFHYIYIYILGYIYLFSYERVILYVI